MYDLSQILAIDTAVDGSGVCVYDRVSGQIFDAYSDDPRGQAQVLIPMVQDVVGQSSGDFEALDAIIVCTGPGTFTGIRIGLSAAQTFGLVGDVPVFGISSLQGLALTAVAKGIEKEMLVIVETRRTDFYVQAFDAQGQAFDEARSVMAEDIDVGGRVLIGNAAERFDADGVYEHCDVRAIDLGVVTKCFFDDRSFFTDSVSPIYLRAPDVSQPKHKNRILSSK